MRRPLRWSVLGRGLQVAVDVLVLFGAFLLAYLIRFEFDLSTVPRRQLAVQLTLVIGLQVMVAVLLGIYSFIWRYVGLREARTILISSLVSAAPLIAFRLLLPGPLAMWRVPLSVTVANGFLAFSGLVGVRVLRRVLYERYEREASASHSRRDLRRPVLLVGAGQAGVLAAREIARGATGLEIRGFVDDDREKAGSVIHGIKVVGTTADLPDLVHRLGIDHVIITIARASRAEFQHILDACAAVPVRVRVIPALYEILDGSVSVSRIRDVQIDDLLGREPVQLDVEGLGQFVGGKTVLVTGAGGSIGSELVRQVSRFGPSQLLLLERAELPLFEIERELRRIQPDLSIVSLIGDVGDEKRMRDVFARWRPAVVFHAAAHKHVPLMEANYGEAVKNNVLGTQVLGEVAGQGEVEAFVLISTDKAVNPGSIMGASKRVAELVVQSLNRRYPTRFIAVRFGNVLGSTGSVVPIFREQIKSGGPVTVTDPAMSRYFMTIPEAAQLVLQAGALGEGGEIFVLDMGEPVRIADLAAEMIRLSGLVPGEDIQIVFTGMRPGEKLFEELDRADEKVAKTRHPKIFIGRISPVPDETVQAGVARLRAAAMAGDEAAVRAGFQELLPEARLGPVNLGSHGHA